MSSLNVETVAISLTRFALPKGWESKLVRPGGNAEKKYDYKFSEKFV